ncbi:MAG: sulfite exporter TauE/SafE family protein [Patescibacteria group bacterium]|nr:sulfite exporter TauE/SafE family protein [Patescibacteria group bacterium]
MTCMAVQGGLLATTIAQREETAYEDNLEKKAKRGHAMPIVWFLLAKLLAYTVLGMLLGWFGSLFELSLAARVVMQFAVGIFMLGTALALLDAHPIFRYFIIQPPKFLTRMLRKESKSKDIFAPALLGAMTVFIPCGTTQAMMALAIASGSILHGSTIMFAFVLGTTPVFFLLGYFASRLGEFWSKKFLKLAAWAIIVLAVYNTNNTIALTGRPYTLGDIAKGAWCGLSYCQPRVVPAAASDVSQQTITIGAYSYSPNSFSVKAGSQVSLHLVNQNGTNCIQTFTIPQLGIQQPVPLGTSADVRFTAPAQKGQLAFMCSMGMYRGTIFVN